MAASVLIIRLVLDHDEWKFVPGDVPEMKKRHKDHKDRMDKQWKNRKGSIINHVFHGHDPIIFLEKEEVQFECEDSSLAFGIGAIKNPDVQSFPGAPDNPFGWEGGIQPFKPNDTPKFQVTATEFDDQGKVKKLGPRAQGFFKFVGWVYVGGLFLVADPDGYCG